MKVYQARILTKEKLSEHFYELTFKINKDFIFQPGQYLWLILPKDGRRAFTISSSNNTLGKISIIFKVEQTLSSFKKTLLSLHLGSKILIRGPAGTPVAFHKDHSFQKCFITNNVGIVPVLSLLRSLDQNSISQNLKIININQNTSEEFLINEVKDLTIKNQIEFTNYTGAFTSSLLRFKDLSEITFYVYGSQKIVDDIYHKLHHLGVKDDHIHFSQTYPSLPTTFSVFPKEEKPSSFLKKNLAHNIYIKFYYSIFSLIGFLLILYLIVRMPSNNIFILVLLLSLFVVNFLVFVFIYSIINSVILSLTNSVRLRENYKLAIEDSSNHIVFTDQNGSILYANQAAQQITGYNFSELERQTPRIWGGEMSPEFYQKLWHTIKTLKKSFVGEISNVRKNGEKYSVIARISPIIDSNGILLGFVGTEEDITKIKELDRAKDEFLSIASHELRTPLSAIDGIVSMMRDGEYGKISSEMKNGFDDINTSTERLLKLVNNLLNLSRIQTGRLKYNLSNFYTDELIGQVMKLFKAVSSEKGLYLKALNIPHFQIYSDIDKVTQILNNLLDNSLKFTHKGGILIKSFKKDSYIVIEVVDSGSGIAKKDQNNLFKRFQQVGFRSINQGSGLGLYISRQIAREMGGDLILKESSPEKGSIFDLLLPSSGSKIAKSVADVINKRDFIHPDQKPDIIKVD